MGSKQESFNQWVVDTLQLIQENPESARLASEALLRESIQRSKEGLKVPQELSKHLLCAFERYFDQLDNNGKTSDPAHLIKEFGINGKKPLDNVDLKVTLRFLLGQFVSGFLAGQETGQPYKLRVEGRPARVLKQIDQKDKISNHKFFYEEGFILGQSKPEKLLRKHITDMIQESFGKEESIVNTYYDKYGLAPENFGYK